MIPAAQGAVSFQIFPWKLQGWRQAAEGSLLRPLGPTLPLPSSTLSLAIKEAGGQAFCEPLQHQHTCNRAPAKHRTTSAEQLS